MKPRLVAAVSISHIVSTFGVIEVMRRVFDWNPRGQWKRREIECQ